MDIENQSRMYEMKTTIYIYSATEDCRLHCFIARIWARLLCPYLHGKYSRAMTDQEGWSASTLCWLTIRDLRHCESAKQSHEMSEWHSPAGSNNLMKAKKQLAGW